MYQPTPEAVASARAALAYPAAPAVAAALAALTGDAYTTGACQDPGLRVTPCNRTQRERELRALHAQIESELTSIPRLPGQQMDNYKVKPEFAGQSASFEVLPGLTVSIALGNKVSAEDAKMLVDHNYAHLLAEVPAPENDAPVATSARASKAAKAE